MSLLQNEDFLIWQLRTSYLTYNKDGVGERLINVDSPALFSDPAVRGAGYAANHDLQRTYSPPIPVATAVSSEYFSGPSRPVGHGSTTLDEDEDDGGMAAGRGSAETVGPGRQTRRKRRKEQPEEDDSSDLSDESDDDAEVSQRAAQQIKFAKMPVRSRAGSSPAPNSKESIGAESRTTVSRHSDSTHHRRGSSGTASSIRQRARRDTTTSSELSSENDIDQIDYRSRHVGAANPTGRINFLEDHTEEEEEEDDDDDDDDDDEDEDEDEDDEGGELGRRETGARIGESRREVSNNESIGSSLSSGFAETADSESLLDVDDADLGTSSLIDLEPPALSVNPPSSPRKTRQPQTDTLQALPPPRPISTVIPVSALGQAIRAQKAKPKNPEEGFARFSGKGALNPLNIRIYAPFSNSPSMPFDMPLQRAVQDSDMGPSEVKVADAIGLCLWRYQEENMQPTIPREKLDVNRWTLRIVDDGEVEYDFPALNRASNMVDFTSNNNRPARGRARGKAYDEFALVEATDAQYAENKRLTPKYTKIFDELSQEPLESSTGRPAVNASDSGSVIDGAPFSTVIHKPFAFASRKGSSTLDQPAIPLVHSTPRMGPPKMLKIHFISLEAQTQSSTIEVTSDTYIAEVLDIVCKRWNLDKAHHFLRVTGTSTAAPLDRTVEVIGGRADLDLVRRRFAHTGTLGLGTSPSSSSPNAPLLLTNITPPTSKKGKKPVVVGSAGGNAHPLSHQQDMWGVPSNQKRYTVVRKQPMSFAPSHSRTLLMDGEYLHILPGETGKTLFDPNAKTTTVPFSLIIGCKISRRHPKTFRVVVFRERETKRYDFEAQSIGEAAEIVAEIRKGMQPFMAGMEEAA